MANDWTAEELRDMIAEAISDSLDMDWQPSWGADAIMRRLADEGLAIQPDLVALVKNNDLLNAMHAYHGGTGPDGPCSPHHDYSIQWGPYDNRHCVSGGSVEEAMAERERVIAAEQVPA